MQTQKTIIEGFTQIDAPGFPKIRTNNYLIRKERLENVQKDIESSLAFGQLGKGFLGKHECGINDMHYGNEINIPFFTEFRTARDENKESLSRTYHFMKNNSPLTIFLLVKNPWKNLIQKENGFYSIQGFIRSPYKELIPRANSELVGIFEKN